MAPPAVSLRAPGAGPAAAPAAAPVAAGPGRGLLPSVRPRLERIFGVDLGKVRVHTDDGAAAAAREAAAKAMTVGSDIFLGAGERDTDLELLAHEVAHVVQQGKAPAVQLAGSARSDPLEREAERAAAAATRNEPVAITGQAGSPSVQRLGISDALDYFADKANIIPGYRMFTIILGVNPINMSRVERSAANILRALIEFMPGGGLITQALDNHGVFEKAGAFVSQQVDAVGLSGASIKASIMEFLDSLGWRDIFRLGSVWDRAKRIFTEPIGKLIQIAKNVVIGIVTLIKDAILRPLAKLAEGTRAWPLLTAVLGKNPITGDPVPRNADTLIGGFMTLIGQQEVWSNMQRARAVPRAWAWFQSALATLIGFVAEIPSMAINAFKSLEIMDIVVLPRAFLKVGRVFANFVGRFISWGLNAVWDLLQIVFDVVSPGAWGYVKKTGAALKSILRNPGPFVGNLVKAAKQGFTSFAGNFVKHLIAGLIDWLTGSLPGVYIPRAFTLPEVVKFVLSVLGISWANVRAKLVRAVGETAVKAMETGFDIVVTLVRDGPAAAWDKIKEHLGNLKDTVIEGIKDFVIDAVTKKAIPKLVAMFIPGAGFISLIISIYDIVMVFVQKIRQIIQVVTTFVSSIVAIAGGQVAAAAKRVEAVLAGLLKLAIAFLAGFAGMGKVADKVMGVMNKVRATIDKGLDKLVEWIVAAARRLGRLIGGTGTAARPTAPLPSAEVKALVKAELSGKSISDPTQAAGLLGGIYGRYQPKGLKSLRLVVDRTKPEKVGVEAGASLAEVIRSLDVTKPDHVQQLRDIAVFMNPFSDYTHMYVFYGPNRIQWGGPIGNETGGGKHAEEVFESRLPSFLTVISGLPKPVPVVLELNRTPCDERCVDVIGRISSTPGIKLTVRAVGHYGRGSQKLASFVAKTDLARLAGTGAQVEALAIWGLLAPKLRAAGFKQIYRRDKRIYTPIDNVQEAAASAWKEEAEFALRLAALTKDKQDLDKLAEVKKGA